MTPGKFVLALLAVLFGAAAVWLDNKECGVCAAAMAVVAFVVPA